jgi:transcriptional regulator of arginine metabolism
MTDPQQRRRRALVEVLRNGAASSQQELARELEGRGFAVTQATISRDLEQVGAIKVRRDGHSVYALPNTAPAAPGPSIEALVRNFVRTIDTAANMVVIKTPPGSAHLVGAALDQSSDEDIIGTVSGDDTLFAACRTAASAEALATRLTAMAFG